MNNKIITLKYLQKIICYIGLQQKNGSDTSAIFPQNAFHSCLLENNYNHINIYCNIIKTEVISLLSSIKQVIKSKS